MSWTQKTFGELLGPTIKRAVKNYLAGQQVLSETRKIFWMDKKKDCGYSSCKRDTIALENCEWHDGEVERFLKVSCIRGIGEKMVKISGNRSILIKAKVLLSSGVCD